MAIIVQDPDTAAVLNTRTVVPLTTNPNAARYPGTVRFTATNENGLAQDSTALASSITSVDKAKVGRPLGTLSEPDQRRLRAALRTYLTLEPPTLPSRWSRIQLGAQSWLQRISGAGDGGRID